MVTLNRERRQGCYIPLSSNVTAIIGKYTKIHQISDPEQHIFTNNH